MSTDHRDPDTGSDLPLHDLDPESTPGGAHGESSGISADRGRRGDGCPGVGIGMDFMTHHTGPISNLNAHLVMRCRGGGSAATLARLEESGLDLGGAATLDELARSCSRTAGRERSEEVLAAMVSLAVADELAAVGALVALTPALVRISRRLIAAGVEYNQADIDVLEVAYEEILAMSHRMSDAEPPERHVARKVIGKSWDRLRWGLRREQRCALRRCRLDSVLEPVVPPEAGSGPRTNVWILTDGVSSGAISAEAARIIHATRVQGRSFRSLAAELHKGESALRKCRQRSERALAELHRGKRLPPGPGEDPGSRSQEVR